MNRALHPIWQSNLECLRPIQPALAEQLIRCPLDENRYPLAVAKDGSPLLTIFLNDGRFAALGHHEFPAQEALGWVDTLGPHFLNSGNLLLLGVGSGYHLLALFQRTNANTHLWIVEPDLVLLKKVLHLHDFRPCLSSRRVRLLSGLSPEETARALFEGPAAHRSLGQGIQLACPPFAQALYRPFLQELARAIPETVALQRLKFETAQQQGAVLLRQILANLPQVVEGTPVSALFSKAAGIPALVVAPGPSLEPALPLLRAAQSKALLIVVDTACRILEKHDLQADLVVSLDFTELNTRHFEGLRSESLYLVAYPGVHPAIPALFRGRAFFYDHVSTVRYAPGASPLLSTLTALGSLGQLISYGSTAHAAYHLARMMGCAPIVLVGNDLAFPADRRYARGAMQETLPENEQAEAAFTVPANNGKPVKTSALYKIYLDSFAELIQGTGGFVWNTSAEGARIAGCPYRPLSDFVVKWNAIDKCFLASALHHPSRPCLADLKTQAQALAARCQAAGKRVQRLLNQANRLSPHASGFSREMLALLKTLHQAIQQDEAVSNLAAGLCSRSTLAFLSQKDNVSLVGDGKPEHNAIALQRCVGLLTEFHQAYRLLVQELRSFAQS
ncbi:MAG: DUF115 domain-containing protein [bacterium]|jgi:hypothetical protein|nr:DUF115 domain-containing protein [bacterium]